MDLRLNGAAKWAQLRFVVSESALSVQSMLGFTSVATFASPFQLRCFGAACSGARGVDRAAATLFQHFCKSVVAVVSAPAWAMGRKSAIAAFYIKRAAASSPRP
jgi:hypothetical protein